MLNSTDTDFILIDLSSALTYGQGTGAHQLVDFVTELTKVFQSQKHGDSVLHVD